MAQADPARSALVDRMRAAALIAQPGYGTDADRHHVFVELANRDFLRCAWRVILDQSCRRLHRAILTVSGTDCVGLGGAHSQAREELRVKPDQDQPGSILSNSKR